MFIVSLKLGKYLENNWNASIIITDSYKWQSYKGTG